MSRRPPFLVALLLIAACVGEAPPTAPEASDPDFVLIDGSTTGNSHFYYLPPLIAGQPSTNGVFDATLRPRVEICQWSMVDEECVPGGATFTYSMTSGPEGERVTIDQDHYKVHFDTKLPGVEPGMVFHARVLIVTLELGSVDIELGATGADVKSLESGENIALKDGRTLPLQFRIEEGAVEEEEAQAEADCHDEFGNVIDCDVEVIEGDQGGTATVFQDPGGGGETLAAIVTIAPNDVVDENGDPVDDFVLTLQHVVEAQAPGEDIPLDQQIPFFVDVTAVDSEGQAVFFQDGASLVLCQPPDLGDPNTDPFVPDALHQFLVIFQVREGVTEILPTTIDDDNCAGSLHGGLNTVGIRSFSGFGATLPTLPSASSAVVPDGTVDVPTVVDIQAQLDADDLQIFGGDEVVVSVSGANTASPVVTDNGDGTYTAQYTPSATGTDVVEIQIRNVVTGNLEPIGGSPFTSEVGTQVSLWSGEDSYGDFWERNDGGPNPAGAVGFDAGIVGRAFRFQRNGGVVGGPGNQIDGLQELSVATWVNIDAGSPERQVQRFVTLAGGEKAVIRQNLAPDAGTGRQLHFYMNFGTVASFDLRELTADGVLEQGCFNHVVGTYDGSDMRLYLNGVEIRSQPVSGTVVTGDGFHFSNGPTFEGLQGRLDEVAVHNRALPASEVATLYSGPAGGQCPQPVAGDVVSVDVQPIGPTLTTGSSLALTATPFDAFGDEVTTAPTATWSSGNTAVATVDASGVVTALSPGVATIAATVDGVAGITRVTVEDPIVLDGVMSPGEWPGSAFGFAANLPEGGTTPATFHWQVSGGSFYAAVRFERTALDAGNTASIEFGPDPSGESSGVQDIILVNGANSFVDDVRLSDGTAPRDTDVGGTNDGSGTVANDGTYTVYEMAHPLDSSDDANDFSLQSGDEITLQLFLRLINGGQIADSTVPTPALTIIIP